MSLVSISPSRKRFPSDQNSFGSYLEGSFYPSNQPSLNQTSVGDYEDITTSQYTVISPSHALESDLGDLRGRRRSTIPRKPITSPSKQKTTTFTASDIELLPLSEESHHLQRPHVGFPHQEWKPFMLRKGPAILLVVACWSLVVVLEVFRSQGSRRQGFSTDNNDLVQFIRYIPTTIVICLGFAWKSLVWDLKIVTPYSAMSRKPTSSDKSIWLNYIDSVEFVSFWSSVRNRHWAIFLALATGLLCGVLVPLANALTFISLNFPVHQTIQTNLNSQFSFENSLSDDNGTLSMSWDYKGGRPYAAIASSRLDNGKNSPWTVDDYAFESVDITPWKSLNATLSVKVQAFNANFNCKHVGYTVDASGTYPHIFADKQDLLAAGCDLKFPLDLIVASNEETTGLGWLNLTDCSGDGSDVRMLATVMDAEFVKRKFVRSNVAGLLCTPIYTQQEAQIQVNGTSGDVVGFSLVNKEPKSVGEIASLPVIVTYLNNPRTYISIPLLLDFVLKMLPVDENSQRAHVVSQAGPWNFNRPQATFKNVTRYASQYQNRDVFFDNLFGDRNVSEYIKDPDLLQRDVTSYASIVLAQVISSLARTEVSIPTAGSVTLTERRLLIRISVLRAMQSILIFMGLICGLCCTLLRPKSRLSEDPGNVAAVAIILSRSGREVERELQEKGAKDNAKGWILTQSQAGGTALECVNIPTSTIQESVCFRS